MSESSIFLRSEWTCGRYDRTTNVAILYNLLEGMCFYYEGVSAEVVGSILCINRNEPFYIEWLSEKSDVSVQSLIPF